MLVCGQEGEQHHAFPEDEGARQLTNRKPTESASFLDALSASEHVVEAKLVQVLCKLELCQHEITACKLLNKEEDRVADIDIVSLLRMDPVQAKLAPSFISLDTHIKSFTCFKSTLSEAELASALMAPYKLELMTTQLDHQLRVQMEKAIARWKEALTLVQDRVVPALPEHWKARVVESCDETFINNKILTKALVDSLGSDYQAACTWIAGIHSTKLELIPCSFATLHVGFLKQVTDVVHDARALVSCVLGYNILYNRMPKQSALERRQSLKDLKKKIKAKFGSDTVLPPKVLDRLSSAIAGK